MAKSYTKNGDEGYSSIRQGNKILKSNKIFNAIGTVDELSCFIGVLKNYVSKEHISDLENIQNNLFYIGSILSASIKQQDQIFFEDQTSNLEKLIDKIEQDLPTLNTFIFPGGSKAAALAHVCRSVSRRAEREVVALENKEILPIIKYLNRLSSYFFVLARLENLKANVKEKEWKA